ncbi:hypothetical protein HDV00_003330 [Rhizophlyctis rosea]|nr:hypothetical protein HDV00_003330 [Rhizophlyctis rosea]
MLSKVEVALIVVVIFLLLIVLRLCVRVTQIERDHYGKSGTFELRTRSQFADLLSEASEFIANVPSTATTTGGSKAKELLKENVEGCRETTHPPLNSNKQTQSQQPITTNSEAPTNHITKPRLLPDEILWEIFPHYLVITCFTGWTTLLLLNHHYSKALLADHTLIRRILLPM